MQKNDILLVHGTNYKQMTKDLLEKADLASDIGDKHTKIGLKPNLNVSKPASSGATTHSELLAGTIEYLQEHHFTNITIMEGSWVGDRTNEAIKVTGYDKICQKYKIPFIDLQKDTWHEYDAKGMKIKLCDKAKAIEYMINMPVLKGHCQTTITCALKNNKGVIPNVEKRRFHMLGLHKPIAHLNTIAHNDFILVDNICGDLDFEEGGNPVVMNRILGFKDPVLCDTFVCEAMGHKPSDVQYVTLAEKLGVGSTDLEHANIIYVNQPSTENVAEIKQKFRTPRRVEQLAKYILPNNACSACYGQLIYALDRLNDMSYLHKNLPKICIGQGYRGKTGTIGIGHCTCKFDHGLQGCPPKASDMLEFLLHNWK